MHSVEAGEIFDCLTHGVKDNSFWQELRWQVLHDRRDGLLGVVCSSYPCNVHNTRIFRPLPPLVLTHSYLEMKIITSASNLFPNGRLFGGWLFARLIRQNCIANHLFASSSAYSMLCTSHNLPFVSNTKLPLGTFTWRWISGFLIIDLSSTKRMRVVLFPT